MNETQSKIVFQTSNRTILFAIALAAFVAENMYYGWNLKAMSNMEHWWDNFTIILLVFSVFVKKLHLVVSKKEIRS